jgi:hypothetical protein
MDEGFPISQARRDEALADIERYIRESDVRRRACKHFHAFNEYLPEDESVCTWEAALDHCEQLKGCFPPTTPETVLENLDVIQAAIRRSKKRETSTAWSVFGSPKLILALLVFLALLWAVSHFVPRGF